jgi:hypothetical protein
MRSAIALTIAALASFSAGQTTPQNNYPYRIDPNSVSSSDRRTSPFPFLSALHPPTTFVHFLLATH